MKLLLYLKRGLQLLLCIALLIHFTIKDSVYASALIFYATPLPLIVFGLLVTTIFVKRTFKKWYVFGAIVVAIFWLDQSFVFSEIPESPDGLQVVLWNAYRTENFEDAFEVNDTIPDVMVLIECDEGWFEELKKKYKNYHFKLTDEAIGIFSKKPLKNITQNNSEDNTTIVRFDTFGMHFYAVDVTANVKYFRKPSLKYIFSEIKTYKKTVVLGDFNTPYGSVFFKNYKKIYTNAFTEKGNGFRETWFWNIPLLSLDHIWVSEDIEVQKTTKIHNTKSDHSMLRTFLKK